MLKLCRVTGMTLTTASHFSNYFTRDIHPLLEVKTSKLLELAASKQWMDWQDEEAKLLFLALANSLNLIEVIPPAIATPTQQVIASSIELLVAIAGWHSHRAFPLPTLRITAEEANSDMLAFPALLTTIVATRAETQQAVATAQQAARLEEAIKVLYAKCSIGANKHKMLREKVADWALKITADAAKKERVDEEVLALWHKMLTTPPIEAYKFQSIIAGKTNNDDIMELDEFMVSNLPHGCTASYEVMKHINSMKNATTGLATFLGVDSFVTVIDTTPLPPEPREADYATKLDWLVAKAKYQQMLASRNQPAPASESITSFPVEEAVADNEEADNEYGI